MPGEENILEIPNDSIIAFYIDANGETDRREDILSRKDKLALIQFIKMEIQKMEAELQSEQRFSRAA